MTRAPDVFFIWYGCWDSACGNAGATTTRTILENFTPNVGGTPYSKSTPCTRICSAKRRVAHSCMPAVLSIPDSAKLGKQPQRTLRNGPGVVVSRWPVTKIIGHRLTSLLKSSLCLCRSQWNHLNDKSLHVHVRRRAF